ncbi:MAG: transcription antitermination factor NusB [Treponema sp.]|jgi:N utilization substance protein B|nr:transcription antitermination factor NusB [Treponema sp.]
MAARRKSRILAFQALFFWDANRVPVEELVTFAWLDDAKLQALDENLAAFAKLLIYGAIENIKVIDSKIKEHLKNWDISRLNRVDLAVIRMSVYSLMFQNEIAPSIIIDEAIEICREFGTDDSYKFVNGVLDSIKLSLLGQSKEQV